MRQAVQARGRRRTGGRAALSAASARPPAPHPAMTRRLALIALLLPALAARRAQVGGQAVIEGVMMRGVDWWSLAVRRPDETIGLHHWPLVSWMKRYPILKLPDPARRRRAGRVARHRHPRPHHLGQRVAGRGGAGAGQEGDRRHARHRLRLRHRPLLHRAAVPHRAHGALARRGLPVLDGRGLRARRHLPRLPRRRHPDQGPAPRVRVPRRRAHEHPRARARRGAHRRQRREVQDPAPALRHVVPAHRAGGLDLRVRGRRPPAVVPAHPQPGRSSSRSSPASATRSSASPGVTRTAGSSASSWRPASRCSG